MKNYSSEDMRVAFLSYDFGEYCIRIASALSKNALVRLWLPQQLASPHLSKLSKSVEFRPFHKPRLRQPWQQLQNTYRLVRQIREFNPDVLHIQQGHLWFNLALPFLKQYPLVMTIHDPRHHLGDAGAHKTPQWIFDFGFRRADRVIVHGRQLEAIVGTELQICQEFIHVIPHVILGDTPTDRPVEEEDHVILFFGRIWGYKGLEYLIRAEPLITAKLPQARIVIAGEGEDFARYRQLMIQPEHFEIYNEYVSPDKTAFLFQRASIVVLPYIEATQSGVIPVAYSFAKPVVATTVGSLPEMVIHGQTGYLVPPRDEQALADTIVSLLRDKGLRRQLGTNAKRMIETECSADAVAGQTFEVYQQAVRTVSFNGSVRH
jgi:glycosyltransferase involved in cell wall biosynthesis